MMVEASLINSLFKGRDVNPKNFTIFLVCNDFYKSLSRIDYNGTSVSRKVEFTVTCVFLTRACSSCQTNSRNFRKLS